jgi:hypothetical protein
LLDQQVDVSILKQTVCGLRFLYEKTLHRTWTVDYIPFPKKHKTHPLYHRFAGLRTLSASGHRYRLEAHGRGGASRQRQARSPGGTLA